MDKKRFRTILLVDDDAFTNQFHKHILRKLIDCEHILSVPNGEEALRFLTHSENDGNVPYPELILLDINMPIMDGWEFMAQYVKLPLSLRQGTFVTMVTSSEDCADREKARVTDGVDLFKKKPLALEAIREIITKISAI